MMFAWLPAIITAQSTPFTSLFDRYSGDTGFETTEILPNNTSFEWEKEMDSSHVKDMMKGIDKISILKYKSESDKDLREKLWKNMQKAASDEVYTELVNVSAEDMLVRIYMIKGLEGITREVALAMNDKDVIMLVIMTGNMDFSSMFSHENMKGLCEMGEYFMQHKGSCDHQEE